MVRDEELAGLVFFVSVFLCLHESRKHMIERGIVVVVFFVPCLEVQHWSYFFLVLGGLG